MSFLAIVLFTACSINPCGPGKKQFLKNFDAFITDIEDQSLAYESEKWEDYDLKFKKFVKECYPEYEEDLTRKEDDQFVANTMKYYYLKYGKGLYEQYKNNGDELADLIGQNLEEFLEINRDATEKLIKNIEENIDAEKIEDFLNEVSDFLNDLDIKLEINKE
jgi:hypothetical protein